MPSDHSVTYGLNMVTYPQALAAVVRDSMAARGVSEKALAEGTGIARTTLIRRLRTGDFTANELVAVAEHLGTDVLALTQDAQQTVGAA